MLSRITLSLAVGIFSFVGLSAQSIPDRPEKLSYPQLAFQVPKSKDYKTQLSNKIPVYVSSDAASAPIVRLSIHWKGGKYLEPDGKEGLAQIYGSLLSQGGSKKMKIAKMEDRLEDFAATINSSCGATVGSISLQCFAKDFNEVFEMMMDSLFQPAFAQDRLELAKRTNKQAVERRNDSVATIANYQLTCLVRGEDFFSAKDPTTASIDSITVEDLQAFHAALLHPSNIVVSVSGQFDKKAVMDRLNSTLGALKPASGAKASPAVPQSNFVRTPGIYVVDKAAPQAMVQWAFPTHLRRDDADWHAATVMNHILGGSFTGRLMKKIRSDEGLTYGIRTGLSGYVYWPSDLHGSSQTSNNTVAYLLRLAIAEMEALKNVPLAESELQAIKDGLVESFPSQWTRLAVADSFAQEAVMGLPEDWWQDYREKIQAVTPAEVQRMAQKILEMEKAVILAVGQADSMEAGDHDRPGALKDVLPLPMQRLPLRDPNTGKPM